MIINQNKLLQAYPFKNMSSTKQHGKIASYGLSEVGYDIRIKETITLSKEHPFALASSIERFDIPNNLVGMIYNKSTWARQAVQVLPVVAEPGWEGNLTIQLIYHGDSEITIPAGEGIAQVIFSEIAVPHNYDGKYQGDSGIQEAKLDEHHYN